jgi:uncharacterized protein YgfB (UPF0149 family)
MISANAIHVDSSVNEIRVGVDSKLEDENVEFEYLLDNDESTLLRSVMFLSAA